MRISERHGGFTLIGLLFLIAGMGVALAALGSVWHTVAQREKEAELLFIGDQYRQALASYRRMTPGTVKNYPASLEDLLSDPRFPNTVRHLRRLYRDPMTGDKEWGVVRDTARNIVGVYSLSEKIPRKKAGFATGLESFADAQSYRDWVFKPAAQADAATDAAATQAQTNRNGTEGSLGADPSTSASNTAQPTDACASAYQGQMSVCQSSYRSGDLPAWRACTAAALISRVECGKASQGGGH